MGPGSVLGGRYVLRSRLGDQGDVASWQAHDDTLDRTVHLTAVAPDHPRVEDVLDAARRAAAVEDVRLVRVLDVGSDDEATFVVTEWLPVHSLEDELARGPLSPADARTVVGESALALEAARHRGLHHLQLAPRHVHLLEDGAVKVTGLAVAAALADEELPDGDEATERDSRDLIALAYAVLTGTWPLDDGSELPAAPRVAGKPVAPAQIVPGVPADLDTLCAQTFGGAGAPDTPGSLAGQIAPWGRQRVEQRSAGAFPHALGQRPGLPTAPTPATAVQRAAAEPPATAVQPSVQSSAEPPVPPAAPHAVPAAGQPSAKPDPQPAQPARPPTGPTPQPALEETLLSPVPAMSAGVADDPSTSGRSMLDELDLRDDGPDDQGRGPDEQRSTRTVIVLVAGFVAVFLVLAYCGLRGLGSPAFTPSSPSATASATKPSTSASTSASPTPTQTPTSESPTGGPIGFTSARGFDPQGDGNEKDDQAARAVDGDPSTYWSTDTYKTEQFSGLKKGVGLLLGLDGEQQVTSVEVKLRTPDVGVELRSADGDQLGPVLAKGQGGETVTLTPDQPVKASQLVVWFTSAAPTDGGYRVEVSEVTAR